MGSTLSTILENSASDAQQEKLATDAMNSLLTIAKNRQQAFLDRVISPKFDTKMIPISKLIYQYQFFRCGVAKEDAVVDEIAGSLDAFINKDVAECLGKLAKSCFKVLFGTYSANQSETTTYAISTGALGGVSRIDADFYSYEYQSDTLSRITKNVVVVTILVSSAKIDDLSYNDLSTIIQDVYSASTLEEQRKIRDEIWKEISDSRASLNKLDNLKGKVFDRLNGGIHQEVSNCKVPSLVSHASHHDQKAHPKYID